MSRGKKTAVKTWDFVTSAAGDQGITVAGTSTQALEDGTLKATFDADTETLFVSLGDNGIPKADLLAVEIVAKFVQIDQYIDARIGLCDAHNAAPDSVAESAWFKIEGTGVSNAHNLFVETDDGTTNNDDVATGLSLPVNDFVRFRIDVATGVQSISPPGKSKGGYGDVRFTMGVDSLGTTFQKHVKLQQFMDMDAASGGFQPYINATASGGTPTQVIHIKELLAEYIVY